MDFEALGNLFNRRRRIAIERLRRAIATDDLDAAERSLQDFAGSVDDEYYRLDRPDRGAGHFEVRKG